MPIFRRSISLAALSVVAAGSFISVTTTPALAADCVGGVENDFDGDGIRDIAVGDPGAEIAGWEGTGAVWIQESRSGQSRTADITWGEGPNWSYDDLFGMSVSSYDYNADGCSDLVIGAPGYDDYSGAVMVVPGSPSGLNGGSAKFYTQDSAGIPGKSEPSDYFGYSVAAGNTAGQPYLIIGSPGEQVDDSWGEGAIHYQRGGITKIIHQNSPGVPGAAEGSDRFGAYLAATPTHFMVSVYTENVSTTNDGMVHVFGHKLSSGVPTSITSLHQDSSGISGAGEKYDEFGGAVTGIAYRPSGATSTGSLFAVSTPLEDLKSNTADDAGAVTAIYVSAAGKVSQVGYYHQDVAGVYGAAEEDDGFGWQVRLGQFGEGAYATPETAMLAVMVAREVGSNYGMGATAVFRFDTTIGNGDAYLVSGTHGLPNQALENPGCPSPSTGKHLILGNPLDGVYGVPWANLRSGRLEGEVIAWDLGAEGHDRVTSSGWCAEII